MDGWLNTLAAQLSAAAPTAEVEPLPEHSAVTTWAQSLARDALAQVEADMAEYGHLTARTAKKVRGI